MARFMCIFSPAELSCPDQRRRTIMAKSGEKLVPLLSQVCGRFQPQQSPTVTTILSTITQYIFSIVQTSVSKVFFAALCVLFVGRRLLQFNLFIDNTVKVISKTRRKAIQTVAGVTLIYLAILFSSNVLFIKCYICTQLLTFFATGLCGCLFPV